MDIQRNNSRRMTLFVLIFALVVNRSSVGAGERKDSRPNILIAISDDQSFANTGAAGDRGVKTPGFDRVAKTGALFTNAFCASPGCSPSRAALLTGRHTWQLEQAGTHDSEFPTKYVVFPDILEQAGYFVGFTGKGWGPGNFKASGRSRNPAGTPFEARKVDAPPGIAMNDYAANLDDFLASRPKDKPFCFWYGGHEPHRKYDEGSGLRNGKKLADAKVPPFLPDSPEVRSDILDYYAEIEWFDRHLSGMLAELEKLGELDNTLVLVTADNGMSFPRAKANCYEYGIHAPLAVCWPKRMPGGRVIDDLVGFVDFAPTILEAAGVPRTAAISGRSFLDVLLSDKSETVDGSRKRVFAARERHSSAREDNLGYPIRAMRTRDYLYIRNFRPERWPAGHPAGVGKDPFGYYDIDAGQSKTFLWEKRDDPTLGGFFHLAVDKRPAEELYDVKSDPGNLQNLAGDAQHAETMKRLRSECEAYLRQTGDPRVIDGGDVFETYNRYSEVRTFPKD